MSLAQQIYKIWKEQHTINLRVYTDEQMFEIGFEEGLKVGRAQERALQIAESDELPTPKKVKKEKAK